VTLSTPNSARCVGCCWWSWLASAALACGGVVTDGSLGPAGAIGKINNDFAIPHSLGTKVGGNLFHSFSEFNLLSGESATYSHPKDVTHILDFSAIAGNITLDAATVAAPTCQ
jgi:large exoprotein involved in heme utilization and adhesion